MYCKYTTKFWCDTTETEESGSGIVCADSYVECVEKLLEMYGKDEVGSFSLEWITNDSCLETETLREAYGTDNKGA